MSTYNGWVATQDSTEARQHRIAAERAAAATLWDEAVREYEAALSLVAAGEAAGEDEAALLARCAVALKLGRVDAAERAYGDGLAWCERELSSAAAIFEAHQARLLLEAVIAIRQ